MVGRGRMKERSAMRARIKPASALGLAIIAMLLVAGAAFASGLRLPFALQRGSADVADGAACDTLADGSAGDTVACDLWAKAGTTGLPGVASIDIWGFAADEAAAAGLPGPTIIVDEGDDVSIMLHNRIGGETMSLSVRGLADPDTTGIASGADKNYDLDVSMPGTYLYEAGLTANGDRQVAMGLYGALIVLPNGCANCAYDGVTFDDDNLLVLSEIDPALNAAPTSFDMHDWAPTYWLINGAAYPDTDLIPAATGEDVLLRYVNAGLSDHSMGLLGLHQTVVANDAFPMAHPYTVVAEIIPAGSTMDTMTTIPGTTAELTQFAVQNVAGHLDNAGSAPAGGTIPFGGQMTFIEVIGAGGLDGGPITSNVAVDPNPAAGPSVALSADIDSSSGNVTAAEYFVDTLGASGTGTTVDAFGAATSVSVGATVATAALTPGNHTIYVHGFAGVWGPVDSVVLNLDTAGPAVFGVSFDPNPTMSGAAITGTASDVGLGGSGVYEAEFFVGGPGADGTGTALTLTDEGAVTTEITGPTGALSEGVNTVWIHAKDCLDSGCTEGNWGPFTTANLTVDQHGPVTSAVSIIPNPNNGTLTYDINKFAAKLSATVSDALSNVTAAEGFIDTAGDPGTGYLFIPADGTFNELVEDVYVEVPLSGILGLSQGDHDLLVHGRDAAGNWGDFSIGTLTVDKTGPALSGISATPNPTLGVSPVLLTATATDSQSNVVAAEWFDGADPGAGNGHAMSGTSFGTLSTPISATINVSSWSNGTHSIGLRAKDEAGNWTVTQRYELVVGPATLLFANSFGPAGLDPWTSSNGNLSIMASGEPDDLTTLQVAISGGTGGKVVDKLAVGVRRFHARFEFDPHGTTTGKAGHPIQIGAAPNGQWIYKVMYRNTGSGAEIRLMVRHADGVRRTPWTPITSSGVSSIEVSWRSGGHAHQRLYVDGELRRSLLRLDTSAYKVKFSRMGAMGNLSAVHGFEEFDNYMSTRSSLIGP